MNHKNLETIFIYLGENIKIETKLTFKFAETFHFCFRDSANFQFFNKTFFFLTFPFTESLKIWKTNWNDRAIFFFLAKFLFIFRPH